MTHRLNLQRAVFTAAGVFWGISLVFGQTEGDLKKAFEGKQFAPKMDMPGSSDGVKINFKNPQPRNFKTDQMNVDRFEIAIPAGQPTMVTEVKAKGDTIELLFGRGVPAGRAAQGCLCPVAVSMCKKLTENMSWN
jgi:hypothetical protein